MRNRSALRCTLSFALVLSTLAACTTWRAQRATPAEVFSSSTADEVRIVRRDHSTIVVRRPRFERDTVFGEVGAPPIPVSVAATDIERVEVRRTDAVRTGGLMLGTAAVLFIIALAATTVAVLTSWN